MGNAVTISWNQVFMASFTPWKNMDTRNQLIFRGLRHKKTAPSKK
jgi:hypothetical protein